MAEDKKSFLLYCDLIHTIDQLPDDKAGLLFKHILSYVNDENPKTDDLIVKISFEPIKQQLKRDLNKYEQIKLKRSLAGKKSAELRQQTAINSTLVESVEQTATKSTVTDTVNVNVNDNVIDKDIYKKTLLSDLKKSDFEDSNFFDITISFYELFKRNLIDAGASIKILEKATGKWVDSIRLMIENDKQDLDNIRLVFQFLQTNDFWKKNILSTAKLREKFNTLLLNSKQNGAKNQGNNAKQGATIEEIRDLASKHFD